MTEGPFSYRQGEELARAFGKHGVDYLFIGKSGAIFLKFPDTTQDADLFPRVDDRLERELVAGKDFVQIRTGPFDLDLVFAPDGIESYDEAKARSVLVAGQFPVAHIDDIIRSKRAANRAKDRESLPRLEAFAAHLRARR